MAFQQHVSDVPLLNIQQLLPEGVYIYNTSNAREFILSANFKVPKENVTERIERETILNTSLKGDIPHLSREPFRCIDVKPKKKKILPNVILLNTNQNKYKFFRYFG